MLPLKNTKNKFILTAGVAAVLLVAYIIFFSQISSTNKALAELDYELDQEVHTETQLKAINDILTETSCRQFIGCKPCTFRIMVFFFPSISALRAKFLELSIGSMI